MRKSLFLLIFISSQVFSQNGGKGVYDFLNLTSSARVASLGGYNVSLSVSDPSLIYLNPALLNDTMSNHLALNFCDYYAGINYGYASYSRTVEKYGDFAIGIHYINYGEFIRADEAGTETGYFYAAEYAFNLSYSKPLNKYFRAGVNVKPIISNFDSYNSFGITSDWGLHFNDPKHLFQAGFVIKNLGAQITSYTGEYTEPVIPEIVIGASKKLRHAPFRFSLTYRNIEKWDLTYEKPEIEGVWTNAFDTVPAETAKIEKIGDNIMRHLVLSSELIITKNLYASFGYNYRRRQELKVETRPAFAGFSWGVGLRISKFHISYARAMYHIAGGTNHISITTNLNSFIKQADS